MKKYLILLCLLVSCCYAVEWIQILDKKYIDISSVSVISAGRVSFWVKALNKKDDEL